MTAPISPNMGLFLPIPTVTPGPEYAVDFTANMSIIDDHNHAGGQGERVPTAGLNINADLSFQNNNLTTLRSARLASQSSVLSGSGDVGCVYEVNGNLYFNNGSGTPIQITAGSVINFTNVLNYASIATSTNHTILSTDIVTILECDPTGNTINVTLPAIASVQPGRFYIVKDETGKSQNHSITISPAGVDTIENNSSYIIADDFAAVGLVSDGVSNWALLPWNRKIYGSGETVSFTNGATLLVDGYSSAANINNISLLGKLSLTSVSVTRSISPYTISQSTPYGVSFVPIFLCDSTAGPITINLPEASTFPGALLTFKDLTGQAGTNKVTLVRTVSDTIEGLSANYLLQIPFQEAMLYSCAPTSNNWALL